MTPERPERLTRALGVRDAVVVGLGAMIGAGIFVAIAPAAAAAGTRLLIPALLIAALVAFCNATSSAQLAARHPASGGTYVYAGARFGPRWGALAGWSFVAAKVASCAALARAFAAYALADAAMPAGGLVANEPSAAWAERALAVGAVTAMTVVNLAGIRKTVTATRVILTVVLVVLAGVVASTAGTGRIAGSTGDGGALGLLRGSALLFFAFAGYARIATLGEEVRDPARTIPRAIPLALLATVAVYALVAWSAASVLGARVGTGDVPLATAVALSRFPALEPVVRAGAAVATLGVLLSLLTAVARTTFAMAADGWMPRALDAVHHRTRIPHRAQVVTGVAVGAIAASADLRASIGFSAFAVLVYYAITNAAALRLGAAERRWPRALAWLGLAGCITLAFALPVSSVVAGAAVVVTGAVVIALRRLEQRGNGVSRG